MSLLTAGETIAASVCMPHLRRCFCVACVTVLSLCLYACTPDTLHRAGFRGSSDCKDHHARLLITRPLGNDYSLAPAIPRAT